MPKWCALYLLVTKVFNCSISSPNHVKKQATTHVLCLVLNESNAMFIKFLIQELSDDWNWVKLSSPAEMAMTPTPQQETRLEHPVRIEEHVTCPDWYDKNEHEWPSNLEDFRIMFWQTTVTGTVVFFVSNVTHCRGVALSYIDVNLAFFDFRTAASIAPRKKIRIRCQGEPVSKPGGISDMLRRQGISWSHWTVWSDVLKLGNFCSKRKNIDIEYIDYNSKCRTQMLQFNLIWWSRDVRSELDQIAKTIEVQ